MAAAAATTTTTTKAEAGAESLQPRLMLPVECARTLSSAGIVFFHATAAVSMLVPLSQRNRHMREVPYLHVLTTGMMLLEVLFVVSGMLAVRGLLAALDRGEPVSFFSIVGRRLLRLWPQYLFVVFIVGRVLGDVQVDALAQLLFFFNAPRYFSTERAVTPVLVAHTWSLCVDVQAHALLALVMLTLRKTGRRRVPIWLLAAVALASVALRAARFDPQAGVSAGAVAHAHPLDVVGREARAFITQHYGAPPAPPDAPDGMPPFMARLYFDTPARLYAFFIGGALGVALREAEAAAVAGMQPVIGGLGRAAFGLVIASGALLTAAMGSPPQDAAVPAMFDWPATVLAGPLTAVAAACVLFAALAPPTHPLASRALRAVMSWRIWAQTGALTYGVFLSHMRWLGFLTLVVWRPALEEVTLPRVLVVASLALLSSAVQAWLMLRLIEAPLLSLVGRRGGESRRTRPKRL